MPSQTLSLNRESDIATPLTELPFPPVTRLHIRNCSYRSSTPKARLIPLPPAFVSYLRADGIVLPPDENATSNARSNWNDDHDSGVFTASNTSSSEDEEDDVDPSADWRPTHEAINATIRELGGKVVPKLNWSAPKDATWINATNSMDCTNANDVYLLLKSSDFVTHDLEHALDGCADDGVVVEESQQEEEANSNSNDATDTPYHLVLRKHVQMNPALEFRCFIRDRTLIAACQRSLNHLPFLHEMREEFLDLIDDFFVEKLRDSFPDPNYAFDVYVPQPYRRVWLIDINPWAPRTDPLLFSWLELLTMRAPVSTQLGEVVRLSLHHNAGVTTADQHETNGLDTSTSQSPSSSSDEEDITTSPELRLINKDDPEAFNFSTPQYSAHKLPKDVVDASKDGPASMREFAETWQEVVRRTELERGQGSEDSHDDDLSIRD
ncbi:MAG: hypothetical protein M1828_006097 [Chrysothrix sp. TS-e1954]|nr:MAG: hypothetical protein M1828_006097 [Chrysothrix sp. TS-e1954]